jgi:8-oxo-dGTP pyrophosphatase MutT (NUDIX family)
LTRISIERVERALGANPPPPLALDPAERYAAVAAVLRDTPGGAEVLLIRRAESEGDPWSGHMALPGGRHDATDADLLATARRETLEEVGLDLARNAALLGALEPLPAIARGRRVGMTIAPFVFGLRVEAALTPNVEVEETLWAPLGDLHAGTGSTTIHWTRDGEDLVLPAWDVQGRIVWGLTYRMLGALLECIRASGS